MPYLIDGHNLIPKIPGLSLRDLDDEIRLIQLLQVHCQRSRKKIEVYFDNAPPGESGSQRFGLVTAHFVHQEGTADEAIRKRLRNLSRAANTWTVVSSDRQVQAAAKASHARVISAEDFSNELVSDPAIDTTGNEFSADTSLSPDEVNEWMEIFKKKDT